MNKVPNRQETCRYLRRRPRLVDACETATGDRGTRDAPGLSPKVSAEEELGALANRYRFRGGGKPRIPERATMRARSWPLFAVATSLPAFQLCAPIDVVTGGLAVTRSPEGPRSFHDVFARESPQPRGQASTAAAAAAAFLSPRTPPSTTTATLTPTRTTVSYYRPPTQSPPIAARRAARKLLLPHAMPAAAGGVILSPGDGDSLAGVGGISLWLDMRTSPLPAAQTLRTLYDDLRERELALGRSPDDPDWALRRVPNPVGALLYASESGGRPAEEIEALGGGAPLPCFQLGNDSDDVLEVPSGDVVGVGIDPVEGGGGGGAGGGAGAGPAIAAVAAAQQAGGGDFVVLRGVRPSAWEGGDMTTVLRIAASACAGSGKTLVVSVRSVGQLHDAAMAALAASQTQVLGRTVDEGPERGATVVLLIEPVPELWEAGLLYL